MNLMSRITRLPIALDPDRGAEARALVPGAEGDLAALIEGAGGCSPYLGGLLEKEREWLERAFDDPEAALDAEFSRLGEVAPGDLGTELRRAKRRVALLTGLADLGGVWALEEVTGALTRFADLAVQLAMRAALEPEIRRGKLPGMGEEDLETCAGWVALAMGKMGAGELNYSSDIDLICLFDESRFERDDYMEARAGFVRATRKMAAMLSDMTGEGYVFRTDLRLRPDPSVTPVCIAMAAAETYYESLGRTWERAAYIKARPCAGDIAAGARFLEMLRPFVWRKHLDFAAIQDAHDMRLRIREHKGLGGRLVLAGHDMKLGRGGIREIEFFTQTRQIIAGGRDPDLRVRGTVEGLRVLAEKGWVPQAAAETLAAHYRAHREVEHRIQMVNDAQTHRLPTSDEGMARIAAMSGQGRPEFEAALRARIDEVHELIESFFAPEEGAAPAPEPLADHAVVSRWTTYPALRSERAVTIFNRLRPEILRKLQDTAQPEEALIAFDGFLSGLPAGVQLFSLFEANPQLVDLLVDIVGTSPTLARHLSRNAGVFDAVIGGDFFADWPGASALAAELAARLEREADYERKLDLARRWAKEWHFRIGVHHLRGLIDAEEAGRQYADLAGASLAALWPEVVAQFAQKHGAPPGRGACVLGMGSLGAARLNAGSDLDLIVIYDPDGVEMSDGRRPLAARPYYARLTQALITAVTAQMSEGRLYEVDMRLRPSGNQGPVATSWESFRAYQSTEAWVWEHMALTRARVVAGEPGLGADVEAFRSAILAEKSENRSGIVRAMASMRARIAAAKAPDGPWEAKIGPGRMQDIELVAQAGALMAAAPGRSVAEGLEAAVASGWLSDADRAALEGSYALCWQVQAVSKLLSDKPLQPESLGGGGASMLMRETGLETLDDLGGRLADLAGRAETVIDAAIARETGEGAA
ncbi:bifunctional [glutamine synthetase] adenylyltransferase/[glutamine synthetase]-adenylyl-L-tyrosine phosphorylase [Aquicoccus porphyridii]|uniref:Bifunctional [glutamine synthetase] adenylyltransferase/[glutamine synthetase]-adenylyl-L-tyrosine phosphorylase n=1 Tax=Aquicoccus porphyridii TaxID=1852029 RepID=A0A5A9ZT67_9RHOB|nr:bifunctional [glutamine synthetase] adenylyltransferase/[glutamine synthetase]-adenylyl-L-tyrosine phosphorylase [Aquicoccus porphyridii]KAA0920136.1 bifunctional [glutamine synthetase] adenylyltransferase/[glutamine synthetase]-adenylyl-L-tyrosine phosphorylase [Aquicoccus porphyridii]RAI55065.1 bifunctional [glutamine synthetase] adenylyltransferase/[glutamine synthetase]-adenylyl-L-tyrosine phosphorylase [Rhodobacteraceae bacterium AsT-22]